MAVLEITISGVLYRVTCDDQSIERLKNISIKLDERIKEKQSALIKAQKSTVNSTAIVLTALQLQDELMDTSEAIKLYNDEIRNKDYIIEDLKLRLEESLFFLSDLRKKLELTIKN